MGVIALPNLQPQGSAPSLDWELRSIGARFQSPLSGISRTLERPGSSWAVTLRYENLSRDKRARMQAFLSSCRGYAQRFYVPDFSRPTLRGSFAAPELLTNNFFASGTTGWTAGGGAAVLSAADGMLRVTRADSALNYQARQSGIPVTPYTPYIARAVMLAGKGPSGLTLQLTDGTVTTTSAAAAGYKTASAVPGASTVDVVAFESTSSGWIPGDYFELGYSSLSRGALVDNGANLLLRSDEFNNATWTKFGTTVTADYWGSPTAPDGTISADALVEDTSTGQHYALQAVTRVNAVADWSFAVALHGGDVGGLRNRAQLRVIDGSTSGFLATFDLLAGTISTAAASAGSAANARAFIAPLGNGWFYCCIVGRLPASDTTVRCAIDMIQNPATDSYTGSSSRNLGVWRATLAQSSMPTRLRQTTAAAATAANQTGTALQLKGLPASTSGLLLVGDPLEVITSVGSEFKRVTAALNSDAGGRGYLQFEPALRNSPADNAAVIVQRPMCRMMLDSNSVRWTERAAGFCDLEFTAVEDVAA
jgi:hypothetical protein